MDVYQKVLSLAVVCDGQTQVDSVLETNQIGERRCLSESMKKPCSGCA